MPGARISRSLPLPSRALLGLSAGAPLIALALGAPSPVRAVDAGFPSAVEEVAVADQLAAVEEAPVVEETAVVKEAAAAEEADALPASVPEVAAAPLELAQAADPAATLAQAEPAQPDPFAPLGDTPATTPVPSTTPGPSPAPAPAAEEPLNPQAREPRVLISEIVVEGLAGHPEQQRLEQAVYDAMTVIPGTQVTRSELRTDLAAIYATGWFADVRMAPQDGPLGVRLIVTASPNPVFTKVSLDPPDAKVPSQVVQDTFAAELGRTINLKTLQTRMEELQKWYADQGYSLARVSGPSRITPEGEVQLLVRQGTVAGVEVQFLNREGSATNDKGEPIRGKTKPWVVTREISIQPGQVFNRRNLEEDLKRLYGTGLFSDVKVTLRPEPATPGEVTIVLGIVEQSTGSISGGLGYSQSQGVFGQVQVQDSNLLGRAWDLATSFTYGQFGGLFDITFTDPWIKNDPYRTAIRIKAFISRDVPQIFQSQNNGNIFTASEFYEAPGTDLAFNTNSNNNPLGKTFANVQEAEEADSSLSWFNYTGNSVVIQRAGGNVQIVRPLNGGNPYKRVPWSVVLGMSGQQVRPIDFSGVSQPFGVATNNFSGRGGNVPINSVICVSYNCATTNQLLGVRAAATMNTLDDPRNPTKGNFLSIGTEQFISVGPDSPTFNRLRASFTHFIPVRWLSLYKGCRPRPGETEDCKQALAFQVSAGTNIGSLPTYEAFCVGGGNSVRGYYDCDLGVGRSFGEATIEYRFPIFSIISGELFFDAGTTFGSQASVPGNPGELLQKPGEGFSVGTGLIVTTPVGPLRLEVASQDFTGEWRFNLGVGWKF